MQTYVPTIADLEAALKHLHNPEALRFNPLATLDIVHERVPSDQRISEHIAPALPWIYGYELAAFLRERIEQLQIDVSATAGQAQQRSSTRPHLYAQILKLRYVDDLSWNEVAEKIGLAAGHIQNKLKRPALQRLLGMLMQRETIERAAPGTLSFLTNLPAPSEFIGRRAETEEVLTKLRRRRMPIIEISGIGGVGKSALAKHIGWSALEERLVDAVVWLSAKGHYLPILGAQATDGREGLRSLDDLFETTARVLGASQIPLVPDARRHQTIDILTSGRFPNGVLIIVDNYETLSPEEQARIVSFLFEELPYPSQALITSRHEEHLLVVQSHILPIKIQLDRMSQEDARDCLEYFLSLQSPPIITNASIKQQIIRISSQIPLAMLWLLGQLRYTPRAQQDILAEISLWSNKSTILLNYIFDHSYDLLQAYPGAKSVLHALTVFSDPVPFEPVATTAALPSGEVEQALYLLLHMSLIVREGADKPYYGLLDLTRNYVNNHFNDAQRQEMMHRAAAYYIGHSVPSDRANVRTLLEWAIRAGHAELVIGLFDALTAAQFLDSETQAQDCVTYGADVVRAAQSLGNQRRADWYELFARCWPRMVRTDQHATRAKLEHLLERAIQQGWQDNRALACSTLGLLYNDMGEAMVQAERDATSQFETAASYLQQAASLWEDLQRHDWLAVVMGRLGTVARHLGDYDRALDYYTWTGALYETLGNQAGRASVLGRCGYTLLQRFRLTGKGDTHEIERLLVEGMQLNEQLGNRWGVAANCLRYAEFLELQGQPTRALSYAERAHTLFSLIPEPGRASQADELINRVQLHLRQSNAENT